MRRMFILSVVLIIANKGAEASTQPCPAQNGSVGAMAKNVDTGAPVQNGHSRRLWPRLSSDDGVKQAPTHKSQCIPCKTTLPDAAQANQFQGNCTRDATMLASQLFTPWYLCNDDRSCKQGDLPPLAGTPMQSSTYDDDSSSWTASKAADRDVNTFSHTQEEKNPWWQLDLGSDKAIGIIRLRNRPGTCASRLFRGTGCDWEYGDSSRYDGANQGSELHVSYESCHGAACSGTTCSKLVVAKPSSHWYEVDCSGARGRYVSVMLPGDNRILHLSEVKVWEATSTTTVIVTTTTTTITTMTGAAAGHAIHSGDTVFLKTQSGTGKYVDVDGGMVQARYGDRGRWQALVIEKEHGGELNSGDKVYLKSHDGVHIDVTEDKVQARWYDFGHWQSMVVEKEFGHGSIQQGDLVCFRTHTGKILDVEKDIVKARYEDCGSQQRMLLQKEVAGGIVSGDLIHIEAHTGKFLHVDGTAVQARWDNRGFWETFAVENKVGHVVLSGDTLLLRCHTGKMLDVQGTSVQCTWNDRGAWQEFTIETEYAGRAVLPGDTIYLQGHTGNEIDIETVAVQARWPHKGAWQSLKIWSATSRRLMDLSAGDSLESVWV